MWVIFWTFLHTHIRTYSTFFRGTNFRKPRKLVLFVIHANFSNLRFDQYFLSYYEKGFATKELIKHFNRKHFTFRKEQYLSSWWRNERLWSQKEGRCPVPLGVTPPRLTCQIHPKHQQSLHGTRRVWIRGLRIDIKNKRNKKQVIYLLQQQKHYFIQKNSFTKNYYTYNL